MTSMSSQLSGLQPEPVLVGRRLVGDTGVQRVGTWPYPTRQVGISAGSDHACGLTQAGAALCWGAGGCGQTNVPPGYTFATITAGTDHSCGLTFSGEAVCWGGCNAGWPTQANETWTMLVAGWYHTCGVKASGEAQCFGPASGSCDFFGRWVCGQTNVPTLPSGVTWTQISVGRSHVCGIKSNREAQCWGGAWNTGYYARTVPSWTLPGTINGQARNVDFWVQISAGSDHNCGVLWHPNWGYEGLWRAARDLNRGDFSACAEVCAFDSLARQLGQ